MADFKKYRLNPETLLYEMEQVPLRSRFLKIGLSVLLSAGLFLVYLWLFTSVLGWELPKTTILRKRNAEWISRMEMLNRQLDRCDATLEGLELRDNEIYRNIFGMNEIGPEVRNAGFGGINRYAPLEQQGASALLLRTEMRLDALMKKAYVQSRSFDDVAALSRRAGDMASCIPAIPPLMTDPSTYRLSSPFGYRSDPLNGSMKLHTGMDFACKPGNSVYATGDGVVETVRFELLGYGNSVIIDHGFGYKTRYAHMKSIYVTEGMKIKRGECIGETGNSGRTSGPHLHYEVFYRNNFVNPVNYMDLTMSMEEYRQMTQKAAAESSNLMIKPHQRIKL